MKLTIYAMYSQSEIPIVKLQTSLLTRLYSLLCVFMPHLDINPTVIKKKKKTRKLLPVPAGRQQHAWIYKMHTFNVQQLRFTDWRYGESG